MALQKLRFFLSRCIIGLVLYLLFIHFCFSIHWERHECLWVSNMDRPHVVSEFYYLFGAILQTFFCLFPQYHLLPTADCLYHPSFLYDILLPRFSPLLDDSLSHEAPKVKKQLKNVKPFKIHRFLKG